ncbi:MAG: glycoside hydrolase family 113 [Bryobacteraceae bacterium]
MRLAIMLLAAASLTGQEHKPFFQKGVNFTAEGPYSSPAAPAILAQLPAYGVNAIALVPYGFTRNGVPEIRFGGRNTWERDDAIEKLANIAHELGMRAMLKPQIWVRPGWPGDLDFRSEADRNKWFAEYRTFLEHYARLATRIQADILCVGVEFGKLSRYQGEWRKLIARARELYSGPLVYAANSGPEFENLQFWDALDYIGLNNYYPLPDNLSTVEVVRKVEAVQKKFKRPVIFPEAGFCSLEDPHRAPWDETPREISLEDQARSYEAVFKAFYQKPWFQGVYWWKVGSNGFGGPEDGSHTPWRKPAMDVIKRWYRLR